VQGLELVSKRTVCPLGRWGTIESRDLPIKFRLRPPGAWCIHPSIQNIQLLTLQQIGFTFSRGGKVTSNALKQRPSQTRTQTYANNENLWLSELTCHQRVLVAINLCSTHYITVGSQFILNLSLNNIFLIVHVITRTINFWCKKNLFYPLKTGFFLNMI
jgi:hypothetical protein